METNIELTRRSDVANFTAWAEAADRKPMPATPQTIRAYLHYLECRHYALAIIKRRVDSIARAHQEHGHDSPTATDPVSKALIEISARSPKTAAKVRPLKYSSMRRAVHNAKAGTYCPASEAEKRAALIGKRDAALIAIGYVAQMEPDQIVGLDAEKFEVKPDGSGLIHAAPSKAALDPETTGLIRDYFLSAKVKRGPMFQSPNGSRLTARDVDWIDLFRPFTLSRR